jgi:mitogen-activated protein kinase organizer 1
MDKMQSVARTIDDHSGAVNAVRLTDDGSYCMTCSDDRSIKLFNPHKADPSKSTSALLIKTYEGAHGYSVLDASIAKDKTKFASCGEDRTCFLWDVATAQTIRRIQAHNHKINAVELNNDTTVVFTASYDQTLKAWDLRTSNRDPIQIMQDFKDSVTCIARTDSALIAGSVDGFIRIYDMRKGQLQNDNLKHPVTSVRVSSDQNCYIASCLDNTVRMVDMASGRVLKEYSGHKHANFKSEAAFDSDCNHIMAGSEDGTVVRWDIVTGAVVGRTEAAHFKAVSSVVCHPSKPIFLTASYDGTVKVWGAPSV